MESFKIIIKSVLLFLGVKFITLFLLSTVCFFFLDLYPLQLSLLFNIPNIASSEGKELLEVCLLNSSTFISSLLSLYLFYLWNPVKGCEVSFSRKKGGGKLVLLSLFLGVVGIVFSGFILSFFQSDYDHLLELSKKILATGWVGVVPVVLFIPILEELVFRKICIVALLTEVKPIWAIILSSVLFGLLHVQPVQILGASILGVVFGCVFYLTRRTLPSIILHVANNGFYVYNLKYGTGKDDLFMTHDMLFWSAFLAVSSLLIVVSILLYKMVRREKYYIYKEK